MATAPIQPLAWEPPHATSAALKRQKNKKIKRKKKTDEWIKNLTSIRKDVGLIPGLAQCVKDLALP